MYSLKLLLFFVCVIGNKKDVRIKIDSVFTAFSQSNFLQAKRITSELYESYSDQLDGWDSLRLAEVIYLISYFEDTSELLLSHYKNYLFLSKHFGSIEISPILGEIIYSNYQDKHTLWKEFWRNAAYPYWHVENFENTGWFYIWEDTEDLFSNKISRLKDKANEASEFAELFM